MPTAERAWRPASGVGEVGLGVDHAEQFDHGLDRRQLANRRPNRPTSNDPSDRFGP